MATTSTAGNFSSTIGGAISAARDNPQLKQLIEEQLDARKLAMTAAKTGGKVYRNRRVARKAARKATAASAKSGGAEPEVLEAQAAKKPAKRHGKGKLLVLLAIVAFSAVLANKDSREKLLDALFGAEEEFEYQSTTTTASVNGNQ